MFFFLIGFGKTTVEDLGSAGTRICPNCGNRAEWRFLRVKRWLTLFFIPIFAYSARDAAVCPICKHESED